MNTNITPFLYGETTVRTVMLKSEPWFVAKDVCELLGLGNVSQAINGNARAGALGLDADEKGVYNLDTLGGSQEILLVNESGLYALIFKSRKAEARVFRKWVTTEVLPTIRRTGAYSSGHQAFLGLLREQMSLGVSPDLAARIASKLCPAAAPAPRGSSLYHDARATRSTMHPADELIAVMEEDRRYTTDDLLALLPKEHRIHQMKPGRGKQSALGRLLHSYVKAQHLRTEIHTGRSLYYRPKVIVDFAHS